MVTYYCHSIEEALRRAKIAGRRAGCYMGGIVLPSGKRVDTLKWIRHKGVSGQNFTEVIMDGDSAKGLVAEDGTVSMDEVFARIAEILGDN